MTKIVNANLISKQFGNFKCSYSENLYSQTSKTLGLPEILDIIGGKKSLRLPAVKNLSPSETLKERIERIRTITDKFIRTDVKKTLPKFYPEVKFKAGASPEQKNIETYTGFCIGDVDMKDQKLSFEQIRKILLKDEFVSFMFQTPSGGLKFAVQIHVVDSKEEFQAYFLSVVEYYEKKGIYLDKAQKNPAQGAFLSYDEDLFTRELPTLYTAKKTVQVVRKQAQNIGTITPEIVKAVNDLVNTNTWILGNNSTHAQYVALGFSVASFGLDARDIFETLCSPWYNKQGLQNTSGKDFEGFLSKYDPAKMSADLLTNLLRKHTTYRGFNVLQYDIELSINQYIGQEKKKAEYLRKVIENHNVLIQAPTGSGKTTFIEELPMRKLIAIPLVSIGAQAEVRGYAVLHEGKTTSAMHETQFVTYDKLVELAAYYDLIVFDEVHRIPSDMSFKGRVFNEVQELIKRYPKKRYVMISATPQPVFDVFKLFDFKRVRIKTAAKMHIKYDVQTTEAIQTAIGIILKFIAEKNGGKLLLKLDNKEALQAIQKYFGGEDVVDIYTSENKDSEHFKTLMHTGKLTKDISICTSVLNDGVNVKDATLLRMVEVNNQGNDLASTIQFFGRDRTGKAEKIALFRKSKDRNFNMYDQYEHLKTIAEKECAYYNKYNDTDNRMHDLLESNILFRSDDQWKVSEFAILHNVYKNQISSMSVETAIAEAMANYPFASFAACENEVSKIDVSELKKDAKEAKKAAEKSIQRMLIETPELVSGWMQATSKNKTLVRLCKDTLPYDRRNDYSKVGIELTSITEKYNDLLESYLFWYLKSENKGLLHTCENLREIQRKQKALNTTKVIEKPRNKREQKRKRDYQQVLKTVTGKQYTIKELAKKLNNELRLVSTKYMTIEDVRTWLLTTEHSVKKVSKNEILYQVLCYKSYSLLSLEFTQYQLVI